MPYEATMRRWVREIDAMCATCDQWLRADPPLLFRPRLFLARRSLGVARLAFLAILALLGTAAFRRF